MKLEELQIYIPEKIPHNFKDLTNTENEYFKIISRAPNGPNHRTRWNCQCKACGNYCVKDGSNLSKHKSCGCNRDNAIGAALRKDLSGKRFGKLTAVEYANKSNKSGNAIWRCKCDCGSFCEVDSNNLTSLHTYSCGCVGQSIGVQNILHLLQNNQIDYALEFAVPGEIKGHPYRFDFAIIQNDFPIRLIEFDGEQHYRAGNGYMANERLQARQERDQRKNQWALQHNIPLVRIPYWERDKITLEMIMGNQYLITSP